MPLNDRQRALLETEAKKRGVDPVALIREAEKLVDAVNAKADTKAPGAAAKGEKPNLYMYHLPFVTVNEVRTIWLDLEPVSGGDEYAGVWAAKQTSGGTAPDGQP